MYLELAENGRPFQAQPMPRVRSNEPQTLNEFFMWVPGDPESGTEGMWVREDLLDHLTDQQFAALEAVQPQPMGGFWDLVTTEAGRERRAERRAQRARRREAKTAATEATGKTGIERMVGKVAGIFSPGDAPAPSGASQRDLPLVTGGVDVNKPFDPTYWIIGGVVVIGGIVAYSALKK